MKRHIKKAIKNLAKILLPNSVKQLFHDYMNFRLSYYEDSNLMDYLIKRYLYKFRNGEYYVKNKGSKIWGNILMGKNSKLALRGGCYIQGLGKLFIGDYVSITQNCIIITANHDIYNQEKHTFKETIIGDHCWIASNACIMAGVVLGPRTIVAAGAVVTKSFPDGYCIVAGNPAKIVKTLDKDKFVPRKYPIEHYGYIRADKFPAYKAKYLSHLKFKYDLSKVTSNSDLIKDSIEDTDS
ncbi:MAG: acyltransferase [Bacteroides sp.]|nr:acyltransferase [Bacteroides sp.]